LDAIVQLSACSDPLSTRFPKEPPVIHINEHRLESDLSYRFHYLSEFMGFGAEDVAAIHAAAAALGPIVPALVDAVYDQLHRYDATWRHFVPRQHGYEGAVPKTVEEATLDHEIIRFRKEHLARYLTILVSKPYDGKMLAYLDMVGKMHTSKAGAAELAVPLVQMNALLGFVADALANTILSLGLERTQEVRTLRAFSKLLWLQNDLINRHYQDGAALVSVA
jgi:Protoglobin